MSKYARLLPGLFLLLGLSPQAHPQALPGVLDKVKSVVTRDDSCWKLHRASERMIDDTKAPGQEWLCDQQVLSIYYFQTPTIEAAARMYHQMINSPVQAPGKPVASPKFGDESSITIGGYSTDSYVFFRRGSIVVRIDSSSLQKIEAARTLKSAIMFAQIVDKEIAAAK